MDSSEMMGYMAEEGEKATAALRRAGWWGVTLEVHVLDDRPNGIGMIIRAADVQGKRTIRVDVVSKNAGWGVRSDISDEGGMILFHTSAAAVDGVPDAVTNVMQKIVQFLTLPDPRQEVKEFARIMELKLRRGDVRHGDSWKSMKVRDLFKLLEDHVAKLAARIRDGSSPVRAEMDGADVANLAMMVVLRRAGHEFTCPKGPLHECKSCGLPPPEDEAERLRSAIRKHRDQRGDDRCWLDDMELYKALQEDAKQEDLALPPREEFLANCARYHEFRQAPGTVALVGKTRGRWITAEEAELFEKLKEKDREGR